MRTLIAFGLLAGAPALAADTGLSFELGSVGTDDPGYAWFTDDDRLGALGVRGQVALSDRVGIVAGWRGSGAGANLYGESDLGNQRLARTHLHLDQFTLGTRVDVQPVDWFIPYASLDALLARGVARIDDDVERDDNPGRVQEAGLAPGGIGMLGVEFQIPRESLEDVYGKVPFTFGLFVEAGYTLASSVDLGTLGDLDVGGFTARGGVGIRL